jgi:acetyl esterase/lipase
MTATYPLPPYDPELLAHFVNPMSEPLSESNYAAFAAGMEMTLDSLTPLIEKYNLDYEERVAQGPRGDVILSILRPRGAGTNLPALFDVHGGGMILCNRFASFTEEALSWAAEHELVIISPEYALAPEFPAPAGALDSFAGLQWTAEHAGELGIDASRIILAGVSGGGGLAASVALLARDKGGPGLLAQMLLCPQLEDRHDTVSSQQFSVANGATDAWPRETNQFAWKALLGEGHEHRDVDIYCSPARATDLSGLPQAFIDAGGNEVFRDAAVAYASKLWASGVGAELHIWPGGFHGFDVLAPNAPVSHSARRARTEWLHRILAS